VADHPDLVSIADGRLLPTSVASSVDRLSLLWSAAQAAWRAADAGRPLDVSLVLTAVR
jgi:hypothetical protein